MEVTHTDLSEVTWMVFIHVGTVVMLTTGKTTTTGMLAAEQMLVNVFFSTAPTPVSFCQLQ
jgi:hypothetical protein